MFRCRKVIERCVRLNLIMKWLINLNILKSQVYYFSFYISNTFFNNSFCISSSIRRRRCIKCRNSTTTMCARIKSRLNVSTFFHNVSRVLILLVQTIVCYTGSASMYCMKGLVLIRKIL